MWLKLEYSRYLWEWKCKNGLENNFHSLNLQVQNLLIRSIISRQKHYAISINFTTEKLKLREQSFT